MTIHPRNGKDAAPFHTTRWTRVCLAKSDSADGRCALADLCDDYYEPVVAYLRCALRDADAARDLSHAFFEELLAGGSIDHADRSRGKFRSYLLGAMKHFVANHRESARSLKRGGGLEVVALDTECASVPDAGQPAPDAEFDRQWAVTVLARGLDALEKECAADGRSGFFDAAKPLLTGDAAHGDQAGIAASCDMGLEAFRMALHRLRKRLRQCVKTEIEGTLSPGAGAQEEMLALFSALGG